MHVTFLQISIFGILSSSSGEFFSASDCTSASKHCLSTVLNSMTKFFHNVMGSMEFKLLLVSVVRCSVLTIFSCLKKCSSDAFEQGLKTNFNYKFCSLPFIGVLALEKNLAPRFDLVNVFKIEINCTNLTMSMYSSTTLSSRICPCQKIDKILS